MSKANSKVELTATERMLADLLAEKERTIMGEFSEQVSSFYRQVEERGGIPSGAIGTTHELNLATYAVEPKGEEGE